MDTIFTEINDFLLGLIPEAYEYMFEDIIVYITFFLVLWLIWTIIMGPILKITRRLFR